MKTVSSSHVVKDCMIGDIFRENMDTSNRSATGIESSDRERSHDRFWILGPSGAGKTTALTLLRETVGSEDKATAKLFTTDLDLFGYRKRDIDWREWIIPPSCLTPLVERGHATSGTVVVAGLGSNMEDLIRQGQALDFEFLVIIPSEETLMEQRRGRGDTPEKVEETPVSLAEWIDRIENFSLTQVYSSADEVAKYIHSRMGLGL